MNDTYVTFTGWLGTDVTLREVAGGQQVASFRVGSTARRLRDGQWADGPTTWYQVKAWRRLATHVAQSLRSGDPVVVHGRLVADVWTKEDGSTASQLLVVATAVGHDLSHGTSRFCRPAPAQPAGQPADRPLTPAAASAEPGAAVPRPDAA